MTSVEPREPDEELLFRLLGDGEHGSIATAESCTGGGVAARLTSIAGSSAYVLGGIVAYSNAAKSALLGVDDGVLRTKGAVSAECARAMARGAQRAFRADWAVSTTGIAGPGGATEHKPVGLVFFAVAGPGIERGEEHVFPGDRAAVTSAAIDTALRMLAGAVAEHVAAPPDQGNS